MLSNKEEKLEENLFVLFDLKQYSKVISHYKGYEGTLQKPDIINIIAVSFVEENLYEECLRFIKALPRNVKENIKRNINSFDPLIISGISSYLELKMNFKALLLSSFYLKRGGQNLVVFSKAKIIKESAIKQIVKFLSLFTTTQFILFYGFDFLFEKLVSKDLFSAWTSLLSAVFFFIFNLLYYFSNIIYDLVGNLVSKNINGVPSVLK